MPNTDFWQQGLLGSRKSLVPLQERPTGVVISECIGNMFGHVKMLQHALPSIKGSIDAAYTRNSLQRLLAGPQFAAATGGARAGAGADDEGIR
jgi:hypothetical protein